MTLSTLVLWLSPNNYPHVNNENKTDFTFTHLKPGSATAINLTVVISLKYTVLSQGNHVDIGLIKR